MGENDLQERLLRFAIDVIKMLRTLMLPNTTFLDLLRCFFANQSLSGNTTNLENKMYQRDFTKRLFHAT
jgi:hypothetical protein